MKRSFLLGIVVATALLASAAGCSRSPKANPCDLLSLDEAKAIDAGIAKGLSFPPQQGETNELCVYQDGAGEPRLMLFVWRGKSSDPVDAVRSGMKSVRDRVTELSGIGDKAAAGFSAADDDTLKLLAAASKTGMVGIRVRDPVKENDEKFSTVKILAARALGRLK